MLKKILCLIIVTMIPFVTASAASRSGASYFNHVGWYAGGDLGIVAYHESNFLAQGETDLGTSGFAMNGKAGYQMLPNLSLEGDYTYYDYKGAHFNSVDAGVKAIVPVAARWGVYAKAGMMDYYKETNDVFQPFWGFGALYALDNHWQLDLQMTGGKLNGLLGSSEVGSYTAGVVYFF